MRLIDADALQDALVKEYNGITGYKTREKFYRAIEIAKNQPIISAPPNAALTFDELREMDGEPVWVERPGYGKKWALVHVWAKSTNIIYLTYSNGSSSILQVELDCGGKIYRRRPEEVENCGN